MTKPLNATYIIQMPGSPICIHSPGSMDVMQTPGSPDDIHSPVADMVHNEEPLHFF